jgi:hypothetical protein
MKTAAVIAVSILGFMTSSSLARRNNFLTRDNSSKLLRDSATTNSTSVDFELEYEDWLGVVEMVVGPDNDTVNFWAAFELGFTALVSPNCTKCLKDSVKIDYNA